MPSESELEPRAHAIDATAIATMTIHVRRIREARPFTRDLALWIRIPNRPTMGRWALQGIALRARDIRRRQIRRVHRDDVARALDANDPDGNERMTIGSRKVD